jgi:hypothetical protein
MIRIQFLKTTVMYTRTYTHAHTERVAMWSATYLRVLKRGLHVNCASKLINCIKTCSFLCLCGYSVVCCSNLHTSQIFTSVYIWVCLLFIDGGPGSSVSIVTDYGLDGPGSNSCTRSTTARLPQRQLIWWSRQESRSVAVYNAACLRHATTNPEHTMGSSLITSQTT